MFTYLAMVAVSMSLIILIWKCFHPQLPKAWLEEPLFDLVGWYRQYVDEAGIFERKYIASHLGIPCPTIACMVSQECYCCARSSHPQLDNCSLMPIKNKDMTKDYIDYPGIDFEYKNSRECMDDIPDLQMVSDSERLMRVLTLRRKTLPQESASKVPPQLD